MKKYLFIFLAISIIIFVLFLINFDKNRANFVSINKSIIVDKCGDNICQLNENCSFCSQDCGECYKKRLKYQTQIEYEIVVFDIGYPPDTDNFKSAIKYIDYFDVLYTKLVYNILGYTTEDILKYSKRDKIIIHIGPVLSDENPYTDYKDVYSIQCYPDGKCGNIIHELIHVFNSPNFLNINWEDDESFTVPLSIYINCYFGAICEEDYEILKNLWENLSFNEYLDREDINYFFRNKDECGYAYTYVMLSQKLDKREIFFTTLYNLFKNSKGDIKNVNKRAQLVYQSTNYDNDIFLFLKSHGCEI